jgi:thymidylate kinase
MNGGIIVEGADQMGKTTFCDKLSKELNMGIIHYAPPKPGINFYNEYTKHIISATRPILFDRNYVSEMVYGPLFRGSSGVTPEIKRQIEDVYNNRNYCLILLNRKNYVWENRPELYTEEQNKLVIANFLKVFSTLKITKLLIDAFDSDSIEKAVNFWKQKNILK